MDSAKKFVPQQIFVWEKAIDHFETQRIIKLFPSANVTTIRNQRITLPPSMPPGKALLKGKRTLMIGQTSRFVTNFDGQLGETVHCLPYYKLVPISNGCPYYCTYCYLAFVYRKYAPYIKMNINHDTMLSQITKVDDSSRTPTSFCMGEMLDSLALDHITNLTTTLVPFFSNLKNSHLILLTKSSSIDNLLALKPSSKIIVSWSLNSEYAIDQYELGTASLQQRIDSAQKCQAHGYRLRLRIDPGILHENWQTDYHELVHKIFNSLKPENITLGTLRLLPGHYTLAKQAYGRHADNLWNNDFNKLTSDDKIRYPAEKRIEFYNLIIDAIRQFDKTVPISICRETPEVWQSLKKLCTQNKCNCVVWPPLT